jgi:CRISPR-associated endonuclease/helicase Cas3
MRYLAHTKNADGKVHPLDEHLREVGKLAESYVAEANPELSEMARWAGLLHDLGKYRDEFQEMLGGTREKGFETHHAVYGAALAMLKGWNTLGFAIAGHHAGLHNLEKLQELINNPAYQIQTSDITQKLQEKFEKELPALPQALGDVDFVKNQHQFEFAVRMIFSALVDADRFDTAWHHNCGKMPTAPPFEPEKLLEKLLAARDKKREAARDSDQQLVAIRNLIFDDCLRKASEPKGFFSLTVPTGGGKTLSAMAFALEHARLHGLRRVIVVIPYLSIIEQNAKEYREIFGPDVVIENHSAVEVKEKPDDKDDQDPLSLVTENWDAPVIVTTSVQFIESLFARKPSKCRKLHNIANSLVIFDEVQTLPAKLLEPLFSVWRELKENYGVSFVFSTATQPAFRRNNNFANGFKDEAELREITTDTTQLYRQLNRVAYDFANLTKPQTWPEIAAEMRAEAQVLCVVNTRRHAFELWNELTGANPEPRADGIYHLSSAMCPAHRLQTIEEIKTRLREGRPCRVVSTQLVEAGVDLDFPVLFRALAPLDSIVQAAGRCNREGKLDKGRVKVFQPANHILPKGIYKNATEITASMNLDTETLATNYEIFAKYFRRVYESNDTGPQIQQNRWDLQFQEVAKEAKVIDDDNISVIVPFGEAVDMLKAVSFNTLKADLRRLQRYMVNLYSNDFQLLQGLGQLTELIPNVNMERYVLTQYVYHEELGVLIKERPTNELTGGV